MNVLISENIFLELNKISQIIKYEKKIVEYSVTNSVLKADIAIDLSYYNLELEEVFEVLNVSFITFLKEDMKVEDLILKDMELQIIERRGISCFYSVDIIYNTIKKEVKKETKFKEISKKEQAINESLKEEIKENYDTLLKETLHTDVEVVSSNGRGSESDFLSFICKMENKYNSLKKIYIKDESMLDSIASKYNLTMNEIYQKYDKENKYVYIVCDE